MISGTTPGPWRYEKSTKTIRAVPTNYWLATMDSWDGAVDHEANANLIAAAPELLQALEIIRDSDGDKEDMREMAVAAIERMNGNPAYCGEDYREARGIKKGQQ